MKPSLREFALPTLERLLLWRKAERVAGGHSGNGTKNSLGTDTQSQQRIHSSSHISIKSLILHPFPYTGLPSKCLRFFILNKTNLTKMHQ